MRKKRECEKRRRERIKQSPEATEELKKLKHEIYLRLKEQGKVKSIKELNRREQKAVRKKWKENTRNRRKRLKAAEELEREIAKNTPPASDIEIENDEQTSPNNHLIETNSVSSPIGGPSMPRFEDNAHKKRGRKQVRKDRAACYRVNEKLKRKIENLKRSCDKYKKKYYRMKHKAEEKEDNIDITPTKKVKAMIRECGQVSNEVRKELLWSTTMKYNLKTKYSELRTQREKQIFAKAVGGNLLRKYRVTGQCRSFLSRKLMKSNSNRLTTLTYERLNSGSKTFLSNKVCKFFERDENSRLCPGKRDIVRKDGISKQKRYLNATMRELHTVFLESNFKISLALFCRLRPFWVVKANPANRDTCLCVKHENMNLIIQKLHFLKIIKENSTFDIVRTLTCPGNERKEDCYKRKCSQCKDKTIMYSAFDGDFQTEVKQWTTEVETRISSKTKKEIKVKITLKRTYPITYVELVNKFENIQDSFLLHNMNIKHQFDAIKELKSKLTSKDLLIHIDFAENYVCKYDTEIQSVHFGASRQQITLLTGVAYSSGLKEAFCTVTPELDHSASAVLAHLTPVLQHYLHQNQEIENLHFLSDSVSSQYRNKTIFHIMSTKLPELLPNIRTQTWNYSEAGHGKGAPDGVGATLKRTADEIVAQGNDINNFDVFFNVIKSKINNILLFSISKESITNSTENLKLSAPNLKPVRGSMKVHQACWTRESDKMMFRTLSCFSCKTSKECPHYHLIEMDVTGVNGEKVDTSVLDTPSDINSPAPDMSSKVQMGDFVAVAFQDNWYPGNFYYHKQFLLISSFKLL